MKTLSVLIAETDQTLSTMLSPFGITPKLPHTADHETTFTVEKTYVIQGWPVVFKRAAVLSLDCLMHMKDVRDRNRFVYDFITRFALSVVKSVMDFHINFKAPQATACDYRPEHMIPEDFYAG